MQCMPSGKGQILILWVESLLVMRRKINPENRRKDHQKGQIQETGYQLGYDNSSPNEKSKSRVHICKKLEVCTRVIWKEKKSLPIKMYFVWRMI